MINVITVLGIVVAVAAFAVWVVVFWDID